MKYDTISGIYINNYNYKVLIIMYKGQFEIYEPKFLTYNAGGTQIVTCWILLEVCGQLFKK